MAAKAILMAGGRGTRISERFPDIPKPLIPIDGVPVLEREIRSLAAQGLTDLILTVSYRHEMIEAYCGDGSRFGVHIRYFVEEVPLGNAGALICLRQELGDEPFLLLNADAVFDVDFNRMLAYHNAHGGLVTLFTHPNAHPYDSALIVADASGRVERWLTKEEVRPQYYTNRVNAGLHILDPRVLDRLDVSPETIGKPNADGKTVKVDLDRQILKPLCGTGAMYCYDSPEYVKDMGTPERYEAVSRDYANGIVTAKNLSSAQKAVFLDRDGTINVYKGFLRSIEDFELIPGVAEAIRCINESGYLAVVVTNQPVIARGEVTRQELDRIHQRMETELGLQGAYIDGLYYCPHHPHKGYAGEIPELKIDCDCRKPKPGMLLRAARELHIDLAASYMVGDGENDILAGNSAGCRSILLNGAGTAGNNGAYGQADTLPSLEMFVRKYLCRGAELQI